MYVVESVGHKVAPVPCTGVKKVEYKSANNEATAEGLRNGGNHLAATVKNTVRRLLRRTKSHRDPPSTTMNNPTDRVKFKLTMPEKIVYKNQCQGEPKPRRKRINDVNVAHQSQQHPKVREIEFSSSDECYFFFFYREKTHVYVDNIAKLLSYIYIALLPLHYCLAHPCSDRRKRNL